MKLVTMSVSVFVHFLDDMNEEFNNEEWEFSRIPTPNEYISTGSDTYYKVLSVVHCSFSSQFQAEVFAVKSQTLSQLMAEAKREAPRAGPPLIG